MKATASSRDPYISLVEYRTMAILDCGKSPAQLLMSRRLSSTLSATPASLQLAQHRPRYNRPSWTHLVTQQRFKDKQETQKLFYDRNAKTWVSQSETRYCWERRRDVARMRSSLWKKTLHGRTMFVRRMVPSTDAPVDISRNRDSTLVMCLAWLRLKPSVWDPECNVP